MRAEMQTLPAVGVATEVSPNLLFNYWILSSSRLPSLDLDQPRHLPEASGHLLSLLKSCVV